MAKLISLGKSTNCDGIYLYKQGDLILDLCYSPDDGGYYWQRHDNDMVSKRIFESRQEAEIAMSTRRVKWE